MMMICGYMFVAVLTLSRTWAQYTPNWESLDSRPLPAWFDEAKIGIFVHWGVFSVPSYHGSNFWQVWQQSPPGSEYRRFIEANYRPDWTYADFGPLFTAELFSPDQWVEMFEAAGAKYVVFVSKHHEGFCNWKTNFSFNWNSVDIGPKRDLVADLADAVRSRTSLRFGVYHSMFEWYNPLYLMDKRNHFRTSHFTQEKTIPELKELVLRYKPDLLWSDGDWEATDSYWQSKEFLAWLYNDSPVKQEVVVNDRWGHGMPCHHGGYLTCKDEFNPQTLQSRKWESCVKLDRLAWGYRRDHVQLTDYRSIEELLSYLVQVVSCGGNLLLNVGPTHDGRILPVFEERLRQLGVWLKVNGEAVYGSKPWCCQNDSLSGNVWYTMRNSTSSPMGTSVYAFFLNWPETNELILGCPITSAVTEVSMLGYDKRLTFESSANRTTVKLPYIPPNRLPSSYAWVIKLDALKNSF